MFIYNIEHYAFAVYRIAVDDAAPDLASDGSARRPSNVLKAPEASINA